MVSQWTESGIPRLENGIRLGLTNHFLSQLRVRAQARSEYPPMKSLSSTTQLLLRNSMFLSLTEIPWSQSTLGGRAPLSLEEY